MIKTNQSPLTTNRAHCCSQLRDHQTRLPLFSTLRCDVVARAKLSPAAPKRPPTSRSLRRLWRLCFLGRTPNKIVNISRQASRRFVNLKSTRKRQLARTANCRVSQRWLQKPILIANSALLVLRLSSYHQLWKTRRWNLKRTAARRQLHFYRSKKLSCR